MGEPWQRFGLQLGCCSVASSQDWPQRQWIDFRESTALVTSNAGLLILGMLTKFEGTAASTWPLVTTGFSTPGTRAVNWVNIEGKNDQFTRGYHLPTMSWSNPVTTSIHPQFHAAPTWTSSGLSSLPGRGKSSSDTEASFLHSVSTTLC